MSRRARACSPASSSPSRHPRATSNDHVHRADSRLPGRASRRGRALPGRARQGAVRQSARRLRAARGARGAIARSDGICSRTPSGAGRGSRSERHDQLHEPRGARSLRRRPRPGDRAQRARRRRAAGTQLDRRSLRCRSARRHHVRPRRRGLEVRLRDVCVCVARAAARRGRGGAAGRHHRAALHLRRGSGRRDRPGLAAGARDQPARLRDLGAGFAYGITTAHNGCLHLEVEVIGKSGHAAEPEKGDRRAGSGHRPADRALRAAQELRGNARRRSRESFRPRWSWG